MARTLITTTTNWVNIGTGPCVLSLVKYQPGVLFLNTAEDEATAQVVTSTIHSNKQIESRSDEDIFVKSTIAGWQLIFDTDGQ